jgi:predicted TPR repeat methyltransferase
VSGRPDAGIAPRFLSLIRQERLAELRMLDVGCGWGRLALAFAAETRHVVGLDRDAGLIAEASRRAAARGLTNAEFHEADVDRVDYAPYAPGLVVSHLFASDAMIERAAAALPRDGVLALVAFHVDQWRETGRVSRFAYDETRMAETLGRASFAVEALEVDREERRFASVEEGLAAAVGLQDRWKTDGRWYRYIAFLEEGGRTLTRSHLLVKARRR